MREETCERFCKECKERLYFGINTFTIYTLNTLCEECRKSKALRLKHNVRLNYKKEMLKEQDNKCAICNTLFLKSSEANVDHCHKTGKVRGLLCRKCNTGLGLLEDSLPNVERALAYLRLHADKTDDKT